MPIKLLSEQVANQIAAGEVVERPASVVKELVENSIDAEATKITVEIKNEHRSIRVADNGSGISPDDIDLAFKRHATSKITNIEDLDNLISNGFRGEALASISAVSKVTCISKRKEDENATKLYLENGKEEKSIAGASNGTSILIDDLFYNTPARLKFLKSGSKEKAEIIDMIRALALGHPEISFSLSIDNKEVVKSTGSNDLKITLGELFSTDIVKGLNEVSFNTGDMKISGYTSSPHLTRSDKRGIFTILNNRAIKCHVMKAAINDVYKDLIPKGKSPITILFLDLATNEVDVNVHPTKKEVKYKNGNKVYTAVGDSISKALSEAFYKRNKDHQTSLKDIELGVKTEQQELDVKRVGDFPDKAPFIKEGIPESSLPEVPDSTFKSEAYQFSAPKRVEVNHSLSLEKFDELQATIDSKNNGESQVEKLESTSRQFVSRLGSVDVSILNNTSLNTVLSQQGNKTTYEIVAKDEENSLAVLLRGNFIGENWIKDKYLAFLNDLANEVLEEELQKTSQVKKSPNRSRPSKKPSLKALEKIWERDNYTCVYCQKALLHPHTVRDALKDSEGAYKTHLNKENKEVTVNLLNEHVATFDHHLPASKFGELNTTKENLYTACFSCNKEKSNSLASKTWTPVRKNAWERPVQIAGKLFNSPD